MNGAATTAVTIMMATQRQRQRRFFLLLLLCSIVVATFGAFSSTRRRSILPIRTTVTTSNKCRRIRSSSSALSSSLSSSSSSSISNNISAADWHRERRRQMLERYGDIIRPLEKHASSYHVALPLLLITNVLLLVFSIVSGSLSVRHVLLLSIFPGSILSLWQLQILHDVVHGSFFSKTTTSRRRCWSLSKQSLQNATLFWGSMPSAFGYYLYLKFGHLTHHKNVGSAAAQNQKNGSNLLTTMFQSNQVDFEDGDVLFVAHRMKLQNNNNNNRTTTSGLPRIRLFGNTTIPMISISTLGFRLWRRTDDGRKNNAAFVWNACMFACSFLFERAMLVMNDVIVAVIRRNLFFPNKPQAFHRECTTYATCASLFRALLLWMVGYKSLLFLYLSETLWSIPPHPACAMFVTNHGSKQQRQEPTMVSVNGNARTTNASSSSTSEEATTSCIPTSSTYAGRWYSILTLGTNYHTEHHDFPTIPLHKLGLLHRVAPEFYPTAAASHVDDHVKEERDDGRRRRRRKDNVWQIMHKAFAYPDFYACMDAGIQGQRNWVMEDVGRVQ